MARGEAFVTCPQCGAQSRIPFTVMQHNNYHCSRCGNPIPLSSVSLPGDNGSGPQGRMRPKRAFPKRKRR